MITGRAGGGFSPGILTDWGGRWAILLVISDDSAVIGDWLPGSPGVVYFSRYFLFYFPPRSFLLAQGKKYPKTGGS